MRNYGASPNLTASDANVTESNDLFEPFEESPNTTATDFTID